MNYFVAKKIIWTSYESLPFEGFLHDKEKGVMCNPGKQNDKVFSCEYIPPVQDVECKGKVDVPKREVFTLEELENDPDAIIIAHISNTPKPSEFANLAYYLPYVNKEEMNCGFGGADDVADVGDDVVADDNRV